MNDRDDMASSRTRTERWTGWRLALLGGVMVVLLVAVLCLAVVGVGGLLWARSTPAQQTLTAPVAEAPAVVSEETDLQEAMVISPTAASPVGVRVDAVNRIAFVDSAGRLGTVAPDGSASRLLTPAGAVYQFPAWSPDGSQIAAVGSDGNEGGVYVWADQAGARRSDLYTSSQRLPIYLYWAPDSRQVSFLANDRAGLGLWLATVESAEPARRIASGQPFYWNWSQRGDQLFIHVGGAGSDAQLAFLDPGSEQTGDNVARPGLFQAPGISADGRYLAYGEADGRRLQVAIADQISGQRTTVPHVGLAALSWSPTAQQLAWTSPRTDRMTSSGPLRLLDVASGEITTLVRDTVVSFFWSPDGQRIAYLTIDGGADNPGAGRPAGLAALSAVPAPQWDDLRLRLAVVNVASGQQRLLSTFRPSAIFASQFLPFFDQYALSHRLWSPASDAIVLPIEESAGVNGVYVISVENGATTRVADGAMAFWSWR